MTACNKVRTTLVMRMTDLPEFHLYGTVELDESGLKVQVLAVRVVDVNCSLLILMLVDVAEVSAQLSTNTSEHLT